MTSKDDDIDITEISREEAHRTIDKQVENLNDIDSKAARILRVNLVVLGLLLTGYSISARPESSQSGAVHTSDLLNSYTTAGVILLLLSTAVAAVTYTASSLEIGVGSGDLRIFLDNDLTDRGNLEGLVEGYAEWIEYNYETNAKNAPLGTLTILLLIFSMTAFSLGAKKAITGAVESWLLIGTIILLGVVVWFTGFISQLKTYDEVRKK